MAQGTYASQILLLLAAWVPTTVLASPAPPRTLPEVSPILAPRDTVTTGVSATSDSAQFRVWCFAMHSPLDMCGDGMYLFSQNCHDLCSCDSLGNINCGCYGYCPDFVVMNLCVTVPAGARCQCLRTDTSDEEAELARNMTAAGMQTTDVEEVRQRKQARKDDSFNMCPS